jgi:hypothetical protein
VIRYILHIMDTEDAGPTGQGGFRVEGVAERVLYNGRHCTLREVADAVAIDLVIGKQPQLNFEIVTSASKEA